MFITIFSQPSKISGGTALECPPRGYGLGDTRGSEGPCFCLINIAVLSYHQAVNNIVGFKVISFFLFLCCAVTGANTEVTDMDISNTPPSDRETAVPPPSRKEFAVKGKTSCCCCFSAGNFT